MGRKVMIQVAKWISKSAVAIALATSGVLFTGTVEPSSAQQLVDGLPPPPPFTPSELSNFPAPPAAGSGAAVGNELYMVYVNGSSPLMLEQVRRVQPDALIQEYQGQPIILVGAYDNAELAEQQILALADEGISATVASVSNLVFDPQLADDDAFATIPELPAADENATVDSTLPAASLPPAVQSTVSRSPSSLPTASVSATPPAGREIEFNPVPSASPPPTTVPTPRVTAARAESDDDDNSYYIVVPGSSDELALMQEQILLLGARQDAVSQRQQPLGPHILVGPFVDRQAASRWNRFLREFGMNARVYYRR